MLLEIPDHIAKQIAENENDLTLQFAIFLYQQEVLSMRAAANFAKISWPAFEQILADQKIPMHYSKSDLEEDVKKLENISAGDCNK